MKTFDLPPWRKRLIEAKYRRKDRLIAKVCRDVDEAMKKAVEYVIAHSKNGHLAIPTVNFREITDAYMIDVVTQAFNSCQDEKRAQGLVKLASRKGAIKLPPELEKVFKDRRYYRSLMNRSRELSDRMKKQYLEKLRKQFAKVLPLIQDGKASPAEVKKMMMYAWKAERPRVETIFRTSTTNYFGEAQVAFFQDDDDIIGFMYDTVRDQSRTEICRSRHGLIYRKSGRGKTSIRYNTPALHYNCRAHLIPLANTPANRKLLADPARDPEKVKVIDLLPGWRN